VEVGLEGPGQVIGLGEEAVRQHLPTGTLVIAAQHHGLLQALQRVLAGAIHAGQQKQAAAVGIGHQAGGLVQAGDLDEAALLIQSRQVRGLCFT